MLDVSLLDLRNADCSQELRSIESSTVDLILTSPPYAEQRKGKYFSVAPDRYAAWFLPIALELKRVLKPSGSLLLNLKSHCHQQERHLYVYELIVALKKLVGFAFVDEYVWYKSAAPRAKSHRLKDCWEPIWHFSIGKNYINHDAIKVASKYTFLNKRGWTSTNDTTGNIGGYHNIADQGFGFTDPDNLLYFPTSLMVKDAAYGHPAKFPVEMAEFFIRGFCPPGGMVLDPFLGSGTSAFAALKCGMSCIGIELEKEFCDLTLRRIDDYREPPIEKFFRMHDIFPDNGLTISASNVE